MREGTVLGVSLDRKMGSLCWLWGVGAHCAADHALKALPGLRPQAAACPQGPVCSSQVLWAGSSQRAWAPSDGLHACSPCRAPVSLPLPPVLAPTPTTVCPAGPQRGAFGNPSVTPCRLGLHPASAEPNAHQRLLQAGGASSAEPLCVGAGPAMAARPRPPSLRAPGRAGL